MERNHDHRLVSSSSSFIDGCNDDDPALVDFLADAGVVVTDTDAGGVL